MNRIYQIYCRKNRFNTSKYIQQQQMKNELKIIEVKQVKTTCLYLFFCVRLRIIVNFIQYQHRTTFFLIPDVKSSAEKREMKLSKRRKRQRSLPYTDEVDFSG